MKSIKTIAENSFNIKNWDMVDWKEDAKELVKERPNRENFIDFICDMFENDKMMRLNGEWHRGIGKSYFLMEVAEEYDMPMVVRHRSMARELHNVYSYIKHKPCELTIVAYDYLKDKNNYKYVLVDEGVPMEFIDKLKRDGIIPIGFISESELYKLI